MTLHLRPVWRDARQSRVLRWTVLVLAVVLIFEYVVLPQLAGEENVVVSLLRLPAVLILSALALEAASLACYSLLTREVLTGTRRPGFFTLFRIDLCDLSVNHTVPGGGTTAAAVRYRLLTRCGVGSQEALSAATIQVVGSNLVLAGLFGVGLLTGLGNMSGNRYLGIAGGVVLVLLAVAVGVLALVDRHLAGAVEAARRMARAIRIIQPDSAGRFVETVAAEVSLFRRNPGRLVAAVLLAALRYLLDAACLWVFVAAYGHVLQPGELLLAYSLAGLVALAPLTPGGLGLVEGLLVPMLTGFGTPANIALMGVLSWRLAQFWLPIPAGGLAYLSLRLGILRRERARRARREAARTP